MSEAIPFPIIPDPSDSVTPESPSPVEAISESAPEFFCKDLSAEEIQEYKVGDPVTRENFTSFLILSFAVSRGDILVQHVFFDWISKISGSGVKAIIREFGAGGSREQLSSAEMALFKDAFNNVRKHTAKFPESEIDDEITDGLVQISDSQLSTKIIMGYFDLDSIKSLSDFNAATRNYMEKTRTAMPKKPW